QLSLPTTSSPQQCPSKACVVPLASCACLLRVLFEDATHRAWLTVQLPPANQLVTSSLSNKCNSESSLLLARFLLRKTRSPQAWVVFRVLPPVSDCETLSRPHGPSFPHSRTRSRRRISLVRASRSRRARPARLGPQHGIRRRRTRRLRPARRSRRAPHRAP